MHELTPEERYKIKAHIETLEAYRASRQGMRRGPVGYRKCYIYNRYVNGAGECARRLRQIAAGSLKRENGLVV